MSVHALFQYLFGRYFLVSVLFGETLSFLFSPFIYKKIFFLYITSSVSFSKVSNFLFLPFFWGGGGGGGEGVWVSLCNIVKENILPLYTHDNSIFWDTR